MITVLSIFLIGVFLSAFFSGNETGFYRVTRLRLVMDGLAGDRVAKRLLWLTNNPSLFVATTLIGNNIANYLTSLAVVMGSHRLMGQSSLAVDIIAPIAMAPVLFIYGESLPKNLFLKVPNYLLRKSGLIFMLFFTVLIPVSSLLWLIGRFLEKIVGQSPVKVRLALARQELDEILQEGHDAGILEQGQRDLANGMFSVVDRPIREFVRPISRFLIRKKEPLIKEIIEFGKRQKTGLVVVESLAGQLQLVKVVELLVQELLNKDINTYSTEPIIDVNDHELHGIILVKMQTEKISIARVVDNQNKPVGFVTINDLTAGLFKK